MKKILITLLSTVFLLLAETLFEVKDSANNKVLDVSTDGLAVMNQGDTIMVISTTEIKAVIDDSKALSRKFSVSTTSAKKGLYTDLFDVSLGSSTMRGGLDGGRYADFSPENMFVGSNAGISNSTGTDNVFIGNNSGLNNISGYQNTSIGVNAGRDNESQFGNVYLGSYAGEENINGGNTFIGNEAGRYGRNSFPEANIGGGSSNTFIGYTAGQYVTGNFNTFIGMSSGVLTGAGADNVFVGHSSGYNSPGGSGNIYIGKGAGYGFNQNPGSDNVYIGKSAGYFSTGSGNVFIGKDSGFNETSSNKLYIANSSTISPIIKGTFPNVDLAINATDIYANGKLTIKGGTAIGMTQAGTVTIGTYVGQTGIKTVTLTYPKAFSTVPRISITPKGANGVSQSFGVTVRDVTTTNCVIMINQLSPTVNGSWSQNLLADWIAWE